MPPKSHPRRPLAVIAILCIALLVVCNMLLIFGFSAESGEESGDRSRDVTVFVARLFIRSFDDLSPEAQAATVESIHGPVRKTAHFLEYALLGFLTSGLLICLRRYLFSAIRGWQTWLFPAAFCLLYAISDEVHQLFVDRGARASDVVIDFCGAVFGICCLQVCVRLIARICRDRREGKETEAV